jgi:hypothetical protein
MQDMSSLKASGIPHPLASPSLMLALEWLRPGPELRTIERLMGRVADAAAITEMLIADADRP